MKILLVSNYQPPHMGGIEFAAEALRDCWRQDGHQVTWLTTDIPKGAVPSTADNARIPAWNILETSLQVNAPVVFPWHRLAIREQVAAHDAVNTHSLSPSLSVLVMREALRQKKPLVVTQHVAVIPLRLKLISALQEWFICREARRAVSNGAYLTFVGQAVRDWFADKARLDASRLKMTPAGINQQIYRFADEEERAAFRTKWKADEHALNVLFVGRFYDKKGLPLIEQVARACPSIRFTLVGGGPLDPKAWQLPNVRVVTFVTNEELRELYAAHDLFFMPSYGEGWPAVVPQAMICGTRCLISEECFTGYQRDRDAFIVSERNVSALTARLQNQADMLPVTSADRLACSDYAARTWDWKSTARIYLDLFQALMT